MATYYWVGGSGNWNATSTTNWATSSGGAGGAGVPTSADDVIFDANSNIGTTAFAVTVTGTTAAPAVCQNFSTGGAGGALDAVLTFTMGATASLNCYGSMTFPASNFTVSATTGCTIAFLPTSSVTFTTNGVGLGNANINFNGSNTGILTLGSALTISTGFLNIISGTFTTNNLNVTVLGILLSSSVAKTVNLGSSTVTSTGAGNSFNYSGSNATFNAGTSSIVCSNANPIFNGNGLTFYNVSFTSTALGSITLNGANTFNNLAFTARAAAGIGICSIASNQIINGTLTLGSGTTGVARLMLASSTIGAQITLTCASIAASVTDIDFRDINLAGAFGAPLTGTRLGDCQGNNATTITFTGARTVYWNSAASANWNAAAWSTSSGSTGGTTTAFPLAQDNIVIDNAGLTTGNTITVNGNYNIPTLDFSSRTTAMTFATGTTTPAFYGNLILDADVTYTGTGAWTFASRVTQTFTSAGKTLTQPITINNGTGTLQLQDNLTLGATLTTTLTSGTLDLSNGNRTLSTGLFNANNSNIRRIIFGTGNITLTGSGTVWNTSAVTNFSYTGTPTVNVSNNSATATTVTTGALLEAQALNFNYTIGTYTLTDADAVYKNLNFTGFTGTVSNLARTIYGNVIYVAGATYTAGANATTFAATSGTQQITTNAQTLNFPLTFNGIGGTFAFQDALTQGSTRNFTVTNGTVQLKNGVTSTVGNFVTVGANRKFLRSSLAGSQATLNQASGTVNASYLTIKDINAVGGATWNAYTDQSNIDAGNVDGWNFGISPVVGGAEYTYTLRSFTQPRRF